VTLLALAEGRFRTEGYPVSVSFERDASGEIAILRVAQGEEERVGSRLPPFDADAVDLSAYLGRYYSPELETFYEVKEEGGTLRAVHIRHDPIVLSPTGPDAFSGDAFFFGEAVFERDDAGRIKALLVSSGRVRNVRFERVSS
jgi:hypothetical protein